MKIRNTLAATALFVSCAACSNPFSFGPGRVEIRLDEASVRAVPHKILFPDSRRNDGVPKERDVLVLAVSSETELLSYFQVRDRQLQVRCRVEGNEGSQRYRGFALSPVPERVLSEGSESSNPRGRYLYIIYSFIDLEAADEMYEGGKPATRLDLRTASFSSLNCHLLGVTKAPGLFPRSNDVSVSADVFRNMVRRASPR